MLEHDMIPSNRAFFRQIVIVQVVLLAVVLKKTSQIFPFNRLFLLKVCRSNHVLESWLMGVRVHLRRDLLLDVLVTGLSIALGAL